MHLTETQLATRLSLGKPVEQWLGWEDRGGHIVIRWLRIEKEKNLQYSVSYHECFDDGHEDFVDIYEFEQFDPDYPYGKIDSFDSYEDALAATINVYGADMSKFVNGGMIQVEYEQYLASRNIIG